ncbi:MAG: hypothetical protein Q9M36_01675, partial [Sulfurovum sp.]|nr:hypothetical protein [Sulfurovum sp.]
CRSRRDSQFDWNVSSELDYDFLTLTIDDENQESISGTTSITRQSIDVANGSTIAWCYTKDSSVSSGLDEDG